MSAQLLSHSEAAGHRPKAAGLPDIDAADRDDPLAAAMYVCDIFSYWQRCEPMFRVGPEYMSRQVPCGHAPLYVPAHGGLAQVFTPPGGSAHGRAVRRLIW